jgi:hypothetical protein
MKKNVVEEQARQRGQQAEVSVDPLEERESLAVAGDEDQGARPPPGTPWWSRLPLERAAPPGIFAAGRQGIDVSQEENAFCDTFRRQNRTVRIPVARGPPCRSGGDGFLLGEWRNNAHDL